MHMPSVCDTFVPRLSTVLAWETILFTAFMLCIVLVPSAVEAHGNGPHVAIRITESEYEPKNIYILQGTEIVWINEDEKEHWPASNSHPTHTHYPGSGIQKCGSDEEADIFDTCRGLSPGESWGFVFNETGKWKYHDHLYPSLGGVIHVFNTEAERALALAEAKDVSMVLRIKEFFVELFRSIAKFLGLFPAPSMPSVEDFRSLPEQEREEMLQKLAEYDAEESWQYLKRAAYENGAQVIDAHELAHIAGNALYIERGFAGIRVCDSTFAFGCYHGVAEKFLREEGPEKTAEAVGICKEIFPGESQYLQYASCAHGLGHGLLTWHALDLYGALGSCDLAPEDARSYCYDGVFMEFSFSASRAQYPVGDPWSLCTNLGEKFYISCSRYQPELMRSILGLSYEEQAEQCVKAPALDLRNPCIGKIGFDATWSNTTNAEGAISFCSNLFSGSSRAVCLTSAAREYVFQEFPGWQVSSTMLCNALSDSERTNCFKERGETIEAYGRQI